MYCNMQCNRFVKLGRFCEHDANGYFEARCDPLLVGFYNEHKGIRSAYWDGICGVLTNMEWSEEAALLLIETYKQHSVLWDPTDPNYFNKIKKKDAWMEIAASMGQPEEACKKKISLLSSHRREKGKEKKSRGTGKGTTEVYMSRWFAYEALRFLQDRDKPRKRVNTEQIEEVINDQYEEHSRLDVENQSDTQPKHREPSVVTPRPPKRTRRQDEDRAMMKDALGILKDAATNLSTCTSENSEITSFCNFLSFKMNSYSPETRTGVQHAVYDIFMKADKGFVEMRSQYFDQHPPRNVGVRSLYNFNSEEYSHRRHQYTYESSPSTSFMPPLGQQPQYSSFSQCPQGISMKRPHSPTIIQQTEPRQNPSQSASTAQSEQLSSSGPSSHCSVYTSSPLPSPSADDFEDYI